MSARRRSPPIGTVAGLAYGLVGPALTASYLDRVEDDRHASVLGIRTATMTAGGIGGLFSWLASTLGPRPPSCSWPRP